MHQWIKGLFALLLACCLALPGAALAEETRAFDGEIVCVAPVSVRAPFGGQVDDFTWREGMRVQMGETVLSLRTQKVYAPADGVVTGLRVQAGDSAQTVIERYGALCYLESEGRYTVTASTAGAANREENRLVHAGETVYLKNPNAAGRTGEGVVTGVSGSAYTIEVTDAGTLRSGDEVSIFREADYEESSRIGRGRTARAQALAISAAGSVLRVHVQEGAAVTRGDLLFDVVSGELDGLQAASEQIAAPLRGTVAQMHVSAGSRVQKDDVLFTLHPDKALEVKISVDEEDVAFFDGALHAQVEIEALEGKRLEGTVVSVAGAPDEAGYAVYIALDLPEGAREGMRVTVQIS
jgi:biotin carboxyl carrier protein